MSLAGDGIYIVAIAFQVLALTNTPTALSLVLLAWSIGLIGCLPVAGVLDDRLDRRTVLIAAEGVQLVATACWASCRWRASWRCGSARRSRSSSAPGRRS